MAAMVPIRGELELSAVQVSGHMWDYEREPIAPDDLLNIMGAEGWELVSVITLGLSESPEETVWKYMLKRPRDQQLPEALASLSTSRG
jgi:hypothetical protein